MIRNKVAGANAGGTMDGSLEPPVKFKKRLNTRGLWQKIKRTNIA